MTQITHDDIEQAHQQLEQLETVKRMVEQDYSIDPNLKAEELRRITTTIEAIKTDIAQAKTQMGSQGNPPRWHR